MIGVDIIAFLDLKTEDLEMLDSFFLDLENTFLDLETEDYTHSLESRISQSRVFPSMFSHFQIKKLSLQAIKQKIAYHEKYHLLSICPRSYWAL